MSDPTTANSIFELQLPNGRKLGDIYAREWPELARRHALLAGIFDRLSSRDHFLDAVFIGQATLSLHRLGKGWRVRASVVGQKAWDLGVSATTPEDAIWAADAVAKQVGCKVASRA